MWTKFKSLFQKKPESTLRESIEELIEEHDEPGTNLGSGEKTYLYNVLKLNDLKVSDIMVPRVDINAIDFENTLDNIIKEFASSGNSRLPVYIKTLDDVMGMVHLKDFMAFILKYPKSKRTKKKFKETIRPLLIIAPSMAAIDLLIKMQKERQHMAVVVDEYGGIDGLLTIEDIVEEIVGEIEDEHDKDERHNFRILKNRHMIADSRCDVEVFEKHFNVKLNVEEFEDIDTIGGLVFSIAGRIPIQGEILKHDFKLMNDGMQPFEFKILDADMRKIKRLKICPSA